MTDQLTPEELVSHYVALREQYRNMPPAPVKPTEPESFDSLDAAYKFMEIARTYQDEVQARRETQNNLAKEIEDLKKRIIRIVPIRNAYVKIGAYGVTTYLETWGGNHLELSVKHWQGGMKPHPNHTYYP